MPVATLISALEFEQLAASDERRLEFFDGEVIELSAPSLIHSFVLRKLDRSLDGHVVSQSLGEVLWGGMFRITENFRFIPDLVFISTTKLAGVDRSQNPAIVIPDLAVEVISPSETAYNVERKVKAYFAAGVSEVWTIYPETQDFHIHSIGLTRDLDSAGTVTSPLFPGWSMPVSTIF